MTTTNPVLDEPDVVAELVRIWRTVLRDDSLHAGSDLLEHGGTSLSAVRVMAHVREVFGRDVDVELVFEHSTPSAFAEVVHTARVWTDDDI